MTRALAILGLLTIGFSGSAGAVGLSQPKPTVHRTAAAHQKNTPAGKTDHTVKIASAAKTQPRLKTAVVAKGTKLAPKKTAALQNNDRHAKPTRRASVRDTGKRRHRQIARSNRPQRRFAQRPAPAVDRSVAMLYPKAVAGSARAVISVPVDTPRRPVSMLIRQYAAAYGVPESLVRRVIARESGFNPAARNGSLVGLMQIHVNTARGLGYRGDCDGLTDPDTNLKYGVAYLANAYRVAQGDESNAVDLYRTGYHTQAKRQGIQAQLIAAR